MLAEQLIPIPFFRLDKSFAVLDQSLKSTHTFAPVVSFLELVDDDSKRKVQQMLNPNRVESRFEVNLRTIENPLVLYQIQARWIDEHTVYVVCIEKEEQIEQLTVLVQSLRQRLEDTDFALLSKTDELQEALERIKENTYQNDKHAMLGKLAAGIAHEIRNPLTSIRGFVQLIQPYLIEVGKEEYARVLISEIDRANSIINEFLNSAKPTKPSKHDILVAELLGEMYLLCQSEASLKGCTIKLGKIDEEMILSIDPKQIKQVLLNIVQNAIDAIDEGENAGRGVIWINAQQVGAFVQVKIQDNGKGMDEALIQRLFDPFFTTKAKGTGLGLSVCKGLIENHGGRIEVASVVGVGSTFLIHLPLQ